MPIPPKRTIKTTNLSFRPVLPCLSTLLSRVSQHNRPSRVSQRNNSNRLVRSMPLSPPYRRSRCFLSVSPLPSFCRTQTHLPAMLAVSGLVLFVRIVVIGAIPTADPPTSEIPLMTPSSSHSSSPSSSLSMSRSKRSVVVHPSSSPRKDSTFSESAGRPFGNDIPLRPEDSEFHRGGFGDSHSPPGVAESFSSAWMESDTECRLLERGTRRRPAWNEYPDAAMWEREAWMSSRDLRFHRLALDPVVLHAAAVKRTHRALVDHGHERIR